MTKDDVRLLVADFVRVRLSLDASPQIEDDAPFVADGLLDSLGFIDLIGHVEEQTGKEVDLLEVDPEDLITVSGLTRYLAEA